MAVLFEIEHATTYRYANPVTFGTHRAMFLPRPAANGRLLSWSVNTSLASRIHWVSDALANNVTVMEFSDPGKELTFTFQFRGIHFGAPVILHTCERCLGSGRIRERGNRIVCKACAGAGKAIAAERVCNNILAQSGR